MEFLLDENKRIADGGVIGKVKGKFQNLLGLRAVAKGDLNPT
jgi:hypothetical protein